MWKQTTDWISATPDIVVANAGRGLQGGVLSSDRDQWEQMFQLNITGNMHLMRIAAEAMQPLKDRPRDLIVIGSVVGTNVSPFSGVYGSTKFAIEAAAEALRREVGKAGVRVTTIKPGIVESEFQDVAGYDHDTFGKVVEKFGDMLQPDDIARAIVFAIQQPANVHINTLTIRPVGQDYP
jgi:NADP-dependent 3-hydroxy acid dehydrogenase YdfG